jgi:hypothetical protein
MIASGREIVMASTITIDLDALGNATIGQLPPGVFYSRFATPPDAQIRDVISINAADSYTVVIDGPDLTIVDLPPLLTLVSSGPEQAVCSLDVNPLPLEQDFGPAFFQVGTVGYSVGFVVNPASLSLPLVIDPEGIYVNQEEVPVGVHVDPAKQKLAVWASGGYTFSFALPAGSPLRFERVELVPESPMLTPSIGEDKLMAWIYNDNLETHSGFQVDVKFHCSDIANGPELVLDPTIINNPINQGGGNDSKVETNPRIELAGALVH